MIANPIRSMPTIQAALTFFSKISYYKVNEAKSLIIPLYLCQSIIKKLTADSNSLYAANYPPLLQQIQTDLNSLTLDTLSLIGRIASFKMLISPKIPYLFRTSPINLPQKFFRQLHTIFAVYIWAGKHPRWALSTLTKPRKMGGMGAPNFKLYHQAVILDQLKFWFTPSQKQWSLMETS